MNALEIAAVIALTGYSVYKQTQRAEVVPAARFKMALVYAIVGICMGGFQVPHTAAGYGMIAASLLLSLVVGLSRGRLTKVWRESDGRVFRQGTALTVSLFLGMVVVKFGLGTWAYFAHVNDGAGFGEVLVMIGIMMAVQAQMVVDRAARLAGLTSAPQAVAA